MANCTIAARCGAFCAITWDILALSWSVRILSLGTSFILGAPGSALFDDEDLKWSGGVKPPIDRINRRATLLGRGEVIPG